ncbi:recombinase family protein [Streptomyces sp. NBC_01808]|uniref:recombinase family protein n=1 Tax=Streptomyces sp. NBC_01808 TaxID=2975947 RepID=UPI002DD9D32C|nr:recombinase family protein [Streptomyces sp. NBC_01808]WSA38654.1 recombinase family protein [Streptomyces sp. NBC_01808]
MDTPTPGTATRPTLAFLYDRHATLATAALDERITRCRRYAVERGWVVAGEWVDRGDAALTNWPRPQWEAMTYAMRQAAARAVCLVESWDRISRDREGSAILRLAVHQVGGYCMTTGGEDDLEPGRGRITVTAPLPRRARP